MSDEAGGNEAVTNNDVIEEAEHIVLKFRAFGYVLNLTRFSILMLAAGCALMMVAQGRDILIFLAERVARGTFLGGALSLFFFAAFYWAFSIWLWTRILLDIRFPDPPSSMKVFNFWAKHLPRLLGTLAFVVVAVALLLVRIGVPVSLKGTITWMIVCALLWGGLFWLITIYRRGLASWVSRRLSKVRLKGAQSLSQAFTTSPMKVDDQDHRRYPNLWQALKGPLGPFALGTLVLGAFFFLASCVNPVWIGSRPWLDVATFFLLWAGSWLATGSVISYFGNRTGLPVLVLLVLGAVLCSFWNDNHKVRTVSYPVVTRPDLQKVLSQWDQQPELAGKEEIPLVIVATAGGGIRAAYWTATVLGELQDKLGQGAPFDRHLLAISGVSGGSVGAAVYRAVLAEQRAHGKAKVASVRASAQRILSHNLLGPAVAALVYPDMTQRFWPWPWLPDRGAALEQGWEQAFTDVMGSDRFGDGSSLVSLYREEGRQWPALFLNATWAESGRRLVASNIRLTAEAFSPAEDQLTQLQADLRLSTAAHNSARFPGVSPGGSWYAGDKVRGHLVDGGYFENFGAETALSILSCAVSTLNPDPKTRKRIRPVVILISSDPTLPKDLYATDSKQPIRFAYEIRAPFKAMLSTRGARGIEAAKRLQDAAEKGGVFAHLRMCSSENGLSDPPLGWALSERAQDMINDYIDQRECGNGGELQRVVAAFQKWSGSVASNEADTAATTAAGE